MRRLGAVVENMCGREHHDTPGDRVWRTVLGSAPFAPPFRAHEPNEAAAQLPIFGVARAVFWSYWHEIHVKSANRNMLNECALKLGNARLRCGEFAFKGAGYFRPNVIAFVKRKPLLREFLGSIRPWRDAHVSQPKIVLR